MSDATIPGPAQPAAPDAGIPPEIAALSYEQARDQLVIVVQQLEGGQTPLEETMALWERGEALAAHCGSWLQRAGQRLDERARSRESAT